ncbi:conjugative transfer signal peptidase TraF [Sphingomonas sp. OV641]|jgi:conjugative transfer signal peptidase TraF|uniref:S26 family signal peptidase n=1 Tax=Sandaracinobacter neustonicus TaxID=1715348 RepID=A0A501XUT0_9SPHN|nr:MULTISPECIES: S26 family signal peptidase [Sphingomonadales]TPE64438.1 S26 family signal peptidase [Sandaracinobacter neustonicus]SEI80458.1 conjugative transfer signal peptidase TraF [Sphingomonas sp. OV641]
MTRRGWAVATASAASLFGASFLAVAVFDPLPRIVWNASASVPIGLYRIEPLPDPPNGALVAVTPPPALAHWLAERGYLGERVPLLKHVTARPGQMVCRINAVVSIDGLPFVIARQRDGRGRPLPVWQGCRTLRAGELLMLNPDRADSMDGRYFGPLPASAVLGRAIPILTRDSPTAPLVWR